MGWDKIDLLTPEEKNIAKNSLMIQGTTCIMIGTAIKAWGTLSLIYPVALIGAGSILFTLELLNKFEGKNDKLFKNIGLCNKEEKYPILLSKKKTNFGFIERYSIPVGLSLINFEKNKEALEVHYKKRIKLKYDNAKNAIIEIYEKELEKNYPYKPIETKGELEFPIGFTWGGKKVILDLKKCVHILICGETGSGKSTIVRSIITYLITKKKASIYLIDLKGGTEFKMFMGCQNVKRFTRNIDEAKEVLIEVMEEVKRRQELFFKNDCKDIESYNKKFRKNPLKEEIVIVDEFSELRDEKKGMKFCEQLAALARSTGIHLILITQSPRAEIVTGLLKSNIPTTIGLLAHDALNSRIIIDESGLEELRGEGHGMVKFAGKITEFQGIFLDEDKAKEILKEYKVNSKVKNGNTNFKPIENALRDDTVKDFDF